MGLRTSKLRFADYNAKNALEGLLSRKHPYAGWPGFVKEWVWTRPAWVRSLPIETRRALAAALRGVAKAARVLPNPAVLVKTEEMVRLIKKIQTYAISQMLRGGVEEGGRAFHQLMDIEASILPLFPAEHKGRLRHLIREAIRKIREMGGMMKRGEPYKYRPNGPGAGDWYVHELLWREAKAGGYEVPHTTRAIAGPFRTHAAALAAGNKMSVPIDVCRGKRPRRWSKRGADQNPRRKQSQKGTSVNPRLAPYPRGGVYQFKTPYYMIQGVARHWGSGANATLPKGKVLVTVYLPTGTAIFETWVDASGERAWKAVRVSKNAPRRNPADRNPLTKEEASGLRTHGRYQYALADAWQRDGRIDMASYHRGRGMEDMEVARVHGPRANVARRNPAKLLTQEDIRRLPALYSQENVADQIAQVKFFTPWTNWTWYAVEFDKKDTFFGLTQGHEDELGYFSLAELSSIRGPMGLRIERDLHFRPTPLSKLKSRASANPRRNPGRPRRESWIRLPAAPGFRPAVWRANRYKAVLVAETVRSKGGYRWGIIPTDREDRRIYGHTVSVAAAKRAAAGAYVRHHGMNPRQRSRR